MDTLPVIKPTIEYTIQPHSRFAREDGWQLIDISLCPTGNIAVSRQNFGIHRASCVCVYSTVDNSDSRDKPILLYDKEFKDKISGWLIGRQISFMEPNSTEIVTCMCMEVHVIDYNRDVVIRYREVNEYTECLSVSEGQIFIGLVSNIVNIYDKDLNEIKSIRLGIRLGIGRYDYPIHMTAAADRLYASTANRGAVVYSQNSGGILTEYNNTGNKAYSVTANVQIAIVAVLWDVGGPKRQVTVYSFTHNNRLVVFDVESGVFRIQISDQGRIVTGNRLTDEVKIYDWVTYNSLKKVWASSLQKDDCRKLADRFCLSKDEPEAILEGDTPATALLFALEKRNIISESNVSRLIEAFIALQMNETFYRVAAIYQEKAKTKPYDRFLVTLSAHLTACVAGDLCGYFAISDRKKTNITSSQNPGLFLLLALHEMGVINQSNVEVLEPPFNKFRLVQAVAKIQEYKSLIGDEKDLYQQTMGLTKEGKRNLFVKLLQKKIKSWYDSMTPVPWKKSCRWKSSELFVGGSLILTSSKTGRTLSNIDEQCKIHYTEILNHVSLKEEKRIIIEGEPGSGKTMLSSQLAYDWSQGKVSDVSMFILLPLKFVETKTLLEAIEEFYQPEGKVISLADIEDIISSEGENCCFLLDGLEEYNGKDETSTEELSEVDQVMAEDKYPDCKVIITSRSGFCQDLPPCPILKLGQFDESQRRCYINKVFSDDHETHMKVEKFIDNTPFILDLCSVPLLFVLVVHNVEDMVSVQNVQQDRIAPFVGRMVETLGTSTQASFESFQETSQMISLESLAFNGLCRGRQQLSWQKRFMEDNVKNFKQYLDSGILVIDDTLNLGKTIDRIAQKIPFSEVPGGGDRHLIQDGNTKQKSESNHTETSECQDNIDKADTQEGGRDVKEGGITESKQTEATVSENSHFKPPLTPQHVSLQVKFLHKVIQEWFAAKHLTDIFYSCGNLSLQEKNRLIREHLEQINPADLHYVLRFTCSLCPPSCHFILNYLFSTYHTKDRNIPEHVMNCICLCFAEYDGYRGHYIKEAISEVCKASITIRSEDSRLLQQAKVSMMQFASKCMLPVSGLQLPDVITKAAGDKLTFNSGTTLRLLDTLQKIKVSRWDQTLREEDYCNIVKFVMNCAAIKDAYLCFPSQPPPLHPDMLKEAAARQVKVTWNIGKFAQTLDLSKGEWQVFQEETGARDVAQIQVTECQPPLQTEATITNTGGTLEIPNTGVVLVVPPNALPEDLVQCKMQMKILRNVMEVDKGASFSSNSSAVVELLPDNLIFHHPVRLMLPHCLVLGEAKDCSAKIFVSHHRQGDSPQWEEQSHLSYHLEDTTCTIFLNSFCWVTYSVNEKIAKARKIVVFAAAKKLHPQDDVAEIAAGFFHDLPGRGCKFLQENPGFTITHMKTFLFRKLKRRYPLQFFLDEIFPSGWQNPEETQKEVSYENVTILPWHASFYFLQKKKNTADNPFCVVMAMQENGQIPVHLAAYPKGSNMDTVSSSWANIHLPQGEASLMKETDITQAGGTCEIPNTGVVLEIPASALPANKKEYKIQMRIILSRKVQDEVAVASFSSNSSVAVELSPSDLSLQHPVKLVLPHCLKFEESADHSVRIYTKHPGQESRSHWEEQTHLKYELKDSACTIWMEELCCVKYTVSDKIVIGKRIVLYTAARKDVQKKDIADVEVGYYPDLPGGGELLRLNPNLTTDVKNMLYFKEEQNCPLHLSLDSIVPPKLSCCFPKQRSQEVPFRMVAWSIEHSYLYVFQKNDGRVRNPVCKFKAFQEGDNSSTALIVRAFSQHQPNAQPSSSIKREKRMVGEESMTDIFQLLSKKLSSEWKDVGRALGISDATMNQIKEDNPNRIREVIYQMFLHWKETVGSAADNSTLVNALSKAGRRDLAEKVPKLQEFLEDFW